MPLNATLLIALTGCKDNKVPLREATTLHRETPVLSVEGLLEGDGLDEADFLSWEFVDGGDVNGDGFNDVLLGSTYSFDQHGSAFLFLGSNTGVSESSYNVNGKEIDPQIAYLLSGAVARGALKEKNQNTFEIFRFALISK